MAGEGVREFARYGLALVCVMTMLGCHTKFPGRSFTGPLPAPTQECLDLAQRLRGHVEMLATTVGERNVYNPDKLLLAAAYIEQTFHARL